MSTMSTSERTSIYTFSEEIQLNAQDVKTLREFLQKEQNNICPICKKQIVNPVLDHQHKKKIGGTGHVRGCICSLCNVFLGKIENSCKRYKISIEELPQVLVNISEYLCAEQTKYLHPSEKPTEPIVSKRQFNKLLKSIKQYNFEMVTVNELISKKPKLIKLPSYPKSGKLSKSLSTLFNDFGIEPFL